MNIENAIVCFVIFLEAERITSHLWSIFSSFLYYQYIWAWTSEGKQICIKFNNMEYKI